MGHCRAASAHAGRFRLTEVERDTPDVGALVAFSAHKNTVDGGRLRPVIDAGQGCSPGVATVAVKAGKASAGSAVVNCH